MKKLLSLFLCFIMLAALYLPVSASTYHGADIAHHSSTINWAQYKKSGHADFVWIKAIEGEHTYDETMVSHVNGARSQKIPYGFYQYFHAYDVNSAKRQADIFYDLIKKYDFAVIPAVDIEETDGRDAPAIQACLRAFVNQFYRRAGYKPIVYTYYAFAIKFIGSGFTDCRLWLAMYRSHTDSVPGWGSSWAAWQYMGSENGKHILGIDNPADFNIANETIFMPGKVPKPNEPAKPNPADIYTTSALPYSWNATVTANTRVLNRDGCDVGAHYVFGGDRICVLNVNYEAQLLEVVYPSGSTFTHGYIRNSGVTYRWAGQWKNGSTKETVYDSSGTVCGSVFARENATPLYKLPSGYVVTYSTGKGANSKSGVVKYAGHFNF